MCLGHTRLKNAGVEGGGTGDRLSCCVQNDLLWCSITSALPSKDHLGSQLSFWVRKTSKAENYASHHHQVPIMKWELIRDFTEARNRARVQFP